MTIATKPRYVGVGIATGVALFVVIALLVTIAANKPQPEGVTSSGPIPESTVAPAEQLGRAFAAVAAHIKPAVVSVYSEKMLTVEGPVLPFGGGLLGRLFGGSGQGGKLKEYQIPQRGMGSGMILDEQGHILTNYHVVSQVDEIKVQLADKRSFEAKVVGTDPMTDVAIIKITGDVPKNLPTVSLGDSDAVEDGNLVIAVGAPFGLTQTVTSGIISAKGRAEVGIAAYEDFLQTDASINPGNSGGPLVNMRGEVIGMNSAIASSRSVGQSAGVAFAIPSNMIKTMLPILIKGGEVVRGVLGVVIQDMNAKLAANFHAPGTNGALVSQVNNDSPAEKAGLKTGDIIVRYDGKDIHNTHELRNLVAATVPGTKLDLGIIRDGDKKTLSVTIGKMLAQTAPTAPRQPQSTSNRLAELGLSVQSVTPDLARQFNLQVDKGALIVNVEPGSPASMANLRPGDVIVECNRAQVNNAGDLQQILDRAKEQAVLLINREGVSAFVVLELK